MFVAVVRCFVLVASVVARAVVISKEVLSMDRTQRWGNKAEQRLARALYEKRPQHARVSLRVLRCADCLGVLPQTHPHELGNRCGKCWNALVVVEGVEVYV
jgi:hypothetical protein